MMVIFRLLGVAWRLLSISFHGKERAQNETVMVDAAEPKSRNTSSNSAILSIFTGYASADIGIEVSSKLNNKRGKPNIKVFQ